MSFAELNLSEQILRAVGEEGYEIATPIQTQAIPHILAGRDLVGCAQTGTGKTAAFALPTLERLITNGSRPREKGRKIRALILSPTRELTSQIAESFRAYGRHTGLKQAVVYGGVGQNPQVRALQNGVDILVATPGRLLDLMNQGHVNLSYVQILILDEADQMFDMGFIHDLRRIVSRVPQDRQTLLFSATMPPPIRQLAQQWLRDPASVAVAPQGTPVELVKQSVYFVEKRHKPKVLAHYLRTEEGQRTLVFTRTKHGADKLVKVLTQAGIRAAAIHGNKSQNARQRALEQFKSQHPPILVATDIAARGLDVDGVSHVVNFDLPMTPEIYVHRIGRTARAGAEGIAVTFCDAEERSMLREIERLTRQKLEVGKLENAPELAAEVSAAVEHPMADSRAHGSRHDRPYQQPRHGGGGGGGYSGQNSRNRRGRSGQSGRAYGGGQGSSSAAPAPAAAFGGRKKKQQRFSRV
jgi:ATP-dependent RNA helicase RhlE